MTGQLIIFVADLSAVAAVPVVGAVAHVQEHAADVAQSWADGCAQLAAWAAALARLARIAEADALAAVVWLLALIRPAHGVHRREVA